MPECKGAFERKDTINPIEFSEKNMNEYEIAKNSPLSINVNAKPLFKRISSYEK
jgi:hypothetical protein